jgi:hypothetical protein
LVCTGEINFAKNGTQKIDAETAILDIEAGTFKPPMYPKFQLTRVDDSSISFGNDNDKYSTWGSLDRVSGSLSMNVMSPNDRKELQAGRSGHFMVWMSGKCAPAKRMF